MQRQATNLLNKIARVGRGTVSSAARELLIKITANDLSEDSNLVISPIHSLSSLYINFTISFFTISIYLKKKVVKGEKN